MKPVGALLAARFPARFPTWHRFVYRWTRGIVGHRWTGFDCLLVTTTGRKTGRRRDSVLTYVSTSDGVCVAGSNGGSDRPPAWLVNLRANPDVQVRVGRRSWATQGEILDPAEPIAVEAWAALNTRRGGRYDTYQSLTDRVIPVVRFRVPTQGQT
ncbi:MAG: hypothetical protein RI958_2205 [Actinomycetota bacterium]